MSELHLYYAGEYLFPGKVDIYASGYNRLLSYGYQKKFVDVVIGMDLFLAGSETENKATKDNLASDGSNILYNYLSGKAATDGIQKKGKLFIDSGAFSAWTKGKQIDVDEYLEWLNNRCDFIDLCGQIDVIPGDIVQGATREQVEEAACKTWENYLYMRSKMIKPEQLLYTFHVGEPYDYLRQALAWRDEKGNPIPYIALGGMVGKPMPAKRGFLNSCFNIIKKSSNPNVKVHAFGMTSFDILEQYPITSADSTSWIMVGANGNIMTSVGIIAVSDKMSMLPEHYSHLPAHLQEAFEKTIQEFGFTLDQLRHSRDARLMFNARYMNKIASQIQHKPDITKKSLF